MNTFCIKALDQNTWPDFARLVEKHNGVWGGCWCMAFHPEGIGKGKTPGQNRAEKELRVLEGRAHAALVYAGAQAVGWCQFGSPEELPRIKLRKEYQAAQTAAPQWLITCFFVDKETRGQGVAEAALRGALEEIARLGGGTVEGFPEDVAGRSVSSSFLHGGTLGLFERLGFERSRRLGMHHWVVTRSVAPEEAG